MRTIHPARAASRSALASLVAAVLLPVAHAATPPVTGPVTPVQPATAPAPASAAVTLGPLGTAPPTTPTPPPPPPPPPPPTGGGNGKLVAVAVGGSCAFAVNGAPKGTSAQLELSMPPGTYSVSCRPDSGPQKTRTVIIKSGETAMAMFKLN